jgi:hypothetical protein
LPRIPALTDNQVRPLSGIPNVRRLNTPTGGLQALGGAIQDIGNVQQKIRQEEQSKADRASFMEADRKAGETENAQLFDPQNGAFTKQGKDAIGLTPKVLSDYDKSTSEIEQGLTTERAKLAFREANTQRRQNIERSLQRHEGDQTQRYYAQERQSYASQAQSTAINYYRDPARIEQEIDKQRAVIDQIPGISADMKSTQLGEARSNTYSGVIDRYLANAEIDGADSYYKAVKDKINGEQATRIESAIRIAKDRRDAEKKANLTELRQSLSDQMRDISAAAQMGMPVSKVPSEGVLKLAFGEHEGGQKYKQAQQAVKFSADVSTLQQKSAAEIVEAVQSYKPTQVEGAADQAQLAQSLAQSGQAILKHRAEDPAGYLTQFAPKTQSAWSKFSQTGDDADREAYISAVNADKQRLGIDSPDILPNDYAKELSNRISNPQSAEGLASLLEAEAKNWGDRWPDVHAQIAKDIPDMAAVIGSGIDRAAAVTLASTAKLKESELTAMLPPGVKWNDVKERVATQFGDVRRSFPPEGARTWGAIEDSATRLAVSYMQAGDSQSNAVQRAYKELVGKQYGVGEIRDMPFLVPNAFEPDNVERGAERFLNNTEFLASSIVVPQGSDPATYTERATVMLQEQGYWVARGDGKGLNLYLASRPTGISKTFEELSTEGVNYRGRTTGKAKEGRY